MAGESAWMQTQHAFASFFDIIVESKFRAERAPGQRLSYTRPMQHRCVT